VRVNTGLATEDASIGGWGLTMPGAEPLALDFGLGRFDEIGEIEFWVANEETCGYCGKFLFVAGGQTCPYHKHHKKHETFRPAPLVHGHWPGVAARSLNAQPAR